MRRIAVHEAQKLGIPVVAIVDTNCSPDGISYVMPGNDDAMRAIHLYAAGIADAALDGQSTSRKSRLARTSSSSSTRKASRSRRAERPPAPRPSAAVRKKQAPRRRLPEKMPEVEPVEEVVAAEVDDVEADVSPEEFMARRKAALAKRKPAQPPAQRLAATPRLRDSCCDSERRSPANRRRDGVIMAVTAEAVKVLRERTGAGMMECKKALVETNGDLDAAAELMRKSGLAKADKKASRVAAEGVIAIERSGRRSLARRSSR